ncbi:DUF11 domain-containing protein [bacterium AH-315-J21]|nr:DUF11 domain-containing protein [bacterium AH-315-J21]
MICRATFNSQTDYFLLTSVNGVWNADLDADGGNDLMTIITTPDSFTRMSVAAINDSGQIAGTMMHIPTSRLRGFLWENGVFTLLPPPNNAILIENLAQDINNAGQIVGFMWSAINGKSTPAIYIWDNGTVILVGEDIGAFPLFINDNSEVVGLTGTPASETSIWKNGVTTNIGNLGANPTIPADINNLGQVIGRSILPQGGFDGFIWENGVMQVIAPSSFLLGLRINNNGEIIGLSNDPNIGDQPNLLWLPEPAYGFEAGVHNLELLIPQAPKFDLFRATDINDNGIIAASGNFGSFLKSNAWLMIPVPPPTITVNSVGDAVDNNPGDGLCNTGNTTAGGDPECTMRAALMESNALVENIVIEFDVPGDPVIQVQSALPIITDTVLISGTTQPGDLPVLLDGLNAGPAVNGLEIRSNAVNVEGIEIGRFGGHGISMVDVTDVRVFGCGIGFSDSAGVDYGNLGSGIQMSDAGNNTIGGIAAWQRNNIANNGKNGITIEGRSVGNIIFNNSIGANPTANPNGNEMSNAGFGVYLWRGADSTVVGSIFDSNASNDIGGNGLSGIGVFGSNNCVIAGNTINDNAQSGLVIDSSSKYTDVRANRIGIASDDSPAGNLMSGIEILGLSDSSIIGDSDFGGSNTIMHNFGHGIRIKLSDYSFVAGNILSSNAFNGLFLDSFSQFSRVVNNKIGIAEDFSVSNNSGCGILIGGGADSNFIGGANDSGNVIMNNGKDGVCLQSSHYSQIVGNVLSANVGSGLHIDSASRYTDVTNNRIGIDSDGIAAGNGGFGVLITNRSDSNVIGGMTLDGNVISANGRSGVALDSSNFNLIQGNIIGLDTTASIAMGNHGEGVLIYGSSFTTVGIDVDRDGNLIGAGNVISGNDSAGVTVTNRSQVTTITANIIGRGVDTVTVLPNMWGVSVDESINTEVGRRGPADEFLGNYILSNNKTGVILNTRTCRVTDNYIGWNGYGVVAGQGAPRGDGVYVVGSSNFIGSETPESYNSIFSNNGVGVFIDESSIVSDDNNPIRFNQITGNVAGGIDLFPQGPNTNDTLDEDGGANEGQNFPVLLTATATGSNQLVVTGTLHSEPNFTYSLDFYWNSVCDSLGLGQGETWLLSDTIETDNFGFATFLSASPPITGPLNGFITSTATRGGISHTSEFSNCLEVVSQIPGVDLLIEKTDNRDTVFVSDTARYEITVTNLGSADASNVVLRDSLPAQLSYVSDSTNAGVCVEIDGIVECNVGGLSSGSSATIIVWGIYVDTGIIVNTAIVSSNETDIQPLNNSATDSTYFATDIQTDVDDDEIAKLPKSFEVHQNFPNPFNPTTVISYSLPIKAEVTIAIYNVLGQRVRSFDRGEQSAGEYSVTWDAADESGKAVASGMYFYKVIAGELSASRKMVLLK